MDELLRMQNITKSYQGQEVLRSVNLEVRPGEIHGLVGENGAGKSTLLGILFGAAQIGKTGGYSGEIFLDGGRVKVRTCGQAIRLGIGMVHQEFALVPEMTVADNVQVGRERVIPFTARCFGESLAYIDRKENARETERVLQRLGLKLDPQMRVTDISVNIRQFVEVAREIGKDNLRLLVLDEPTAVLSREDAGRLLAVVRDLAARGTGVILVSHRLEEVMEVSDRITVLRDGQVAGVYTRPEFNRPRLISDMLGKAVVETTRRSRQASGRPVLSFQDFCVDMPGEKLRGLTLNIYEGEITGITGLSGHGKLAVGNGVMGMYPSTGRVLVDGVEIDTARPAEVIMKEVLYLPEDRRQAGLLLERSVAENVVFTATQRRNRFLRPFFYDSLRLVDRKKAGEYAEKCVQALDIRCQGIDQRVGLLSGGNQQKVCLARALAAEPRMLIVAEPTRGVDIGAKEKILEALVRINEECGTTVILISSELAELKRVCDRIAVLYDGRLNGVFEPEAGDNIFAGAFTGETCVSTGS